MYRLFQIRPTEEQYELVNEFGWSKACEDIPIIEASQALRMGGSEAYVTEYDQFFEHVSDIDVRDLEQAFHVHNMQDESKIKRYGPQHSMSVGDVLVGEYGDVHMVDGFGFTQLLSSAVGTECLAAS